MIIRKTTAADLAVAVQIYRDARVFMRENGNPTQWNREYPNRESILSDMDEGVGYVCEENGRVLAVFMFQVGRDETYDRIYGGAWLNAEPYAVIHRIAVASDAHGRGVAGFCFAECFKRFPNLKIDTHRDNLPMQRSLEKNGFLRCGIIHLANGDERIAFQKSEA